HTRSDRDWSSDVCSSDLLLAPLLRDERVTEVMVNGLRGVWVEREGQLEQTAIRFVDPEEIMVIIERLVAPLGRRIDLASPLVDEIGRASCRERGGVWDGD